MLALKVNLRLNLTPFIFVIRKEQCEKDDKEIKYNLKINQILKIEILVKI